MKIIIIGAGPGGYETALEAAKRGAEVVLFEAGEVGGTCLNRGCIPTKALCRSAEILEEMRSAERFGFCDVSWKPDFDRIFGRKTEVVGSLRAGVEALLSASSVTLVRGRARLKNRDTVICDSEPEKEYRADAVIIATGASPAVLPVPGATLGDVLTSDSLLAMDRIPDSLCIIGAGVIGLEFASIYRSFGTEVTVLEYCKEALPRFDQDVAKRLRQSLSKRGITFNMQSQVTGLEQCADGVEVSFVRKGRQESVVAQKVLMAVGRVPCVGGLGLDEAGVSYSRKGILVDAGMQTNVPGIYAIGDVTGGIMLAHAATYQGIRALNSIFGEPDGIRPDVVPAAVFTMPEAASVGLTEEDCAEKGIAVSVRKSFFRANGKAVCMDAVEGICKAVVSGDGRILGVHILGPHASALIHEAAVAVAKGLTLKDLAEIIHAHPTLSEVFRF